MIRIGIIVDGFYYMRYLLRCNALVGEVRGHSINNKTFNIYARWICFGDRQLNNNKFAKNAICFSI